MQIPLSIQDIETETVSSRDIEIALRNILELVQANFDESSLEVSLIEQLISVHK